MEAAQRLRERAVQEQLQALEDRLNQQQQKHLQVTCLSCCLVPLCMDCCPAI